MRKQLRLLLVWVRRPKIIIILSIVTVALVTAMAILLSSKHAAQPASPTPLSPANHTQSGTEQLHILTDNIGDGSECDSGNTGAYDCLSFVNDQIQSYNPSAISVDEVCESVYQKFQATHPSWTVNYGTDAAPDVKKCGYETIGGRQFAQSHGNLVAIANQHAPVTNFRLASNPTDKDAYKLICAQTIALTINVWMCSVHLPFRATNATRLVQVENIVADVNTLHGVVVVAGDFNMNQNDPSLNPFKAANYIETDPLNQATSRGTNGGASKFDFIWYHADPHTSELFSNPIGTIIAQPSEHFDHNMLEGSVTLAAQ